jgi:formate dehydrogenase maturation protein FdhE
VSEPRAPHPPPAPSARAEPREIAELRRLKQDQPDLAAAADLQIELIQIQRRIQIRVPLPSIRLEAEYLNQLLTKGPVLQFEHLPIDWSDLRFLLRATATAMRKHDALEDADYRRAEELSRLSDSLPGIIRTWYDSVLPNAAPVSPEAAGIENVVQQAMRPFLTRSSEAVMARTDLASWNRPGCPLCGGEPDLAVITAAADRLLICGRCAGRWRFEPLTCPFCLNSDRSRITSFASRDGQYRLYACDVCQRYVKAYDARRASRPVMPVVDGVATLPLDAAAIQKGYR